MKVTFLIKKNSKIINLKINIGSCSIDLLTKTAINSLHYVIYYFRSCVRIWAIFLPKKCLLKNIKLLV